jgi:hypothetical protein
VKPCLAVTKAPLPPAGPSVAGSSVRFSRATFSGGTVDLTNPRLWEVPPTFDSGRDAEPPPVCCYQGPRHSRRLIGQLPMTDKGQCPRASRARPDLDAEELCPCAHRRSLSIPRRQPTSTLLLSACFVTRLGARLRISVAVVCRFA